MHDPNGEEMAGAGKPAPKKMLVKKPVKVAPAPVKKPMVLRIKKPIVISKPPTRPAFKPAVAPDKQQIVTNAVNTVVARRANYLAAEAKKRGNAAATGAQFMPSAQSWAKAEFRRLTIPTNTAQLPAFWAQAVGVIKTKTDQALEAIARRGAPSQTWTSKKIMPAPVAVAPTPMPAPQAPPPAPEPETTTMLVMEPGSVPMPQPRMEEWKALPVEEGTAEEFVSEMPPVETPEVEERLDEAMEDLADAVEESEESKEDEETEEEETEMDDIMGATDIMGAYASVMGVSPYLCGAVAKAAAKKPAVKAQVKKAAKIVDKAQKGDPVAKAQVATIAKKAKAGDPKAKQAAAAITVAATAKKVAAKKVAVKKAVAARSVPGGAFSTYWRGQQL